MMTRMRFFITKRLVRSGGIINDFISERKPERLFRTLAGLGYAKHDEDKIIVLLDINMPRQDGFETLRQIRSSAMFEDIPVIMLSASENESDMLMATELGANGYLVKPFRSDAFFSALKDVAQVEHQLVVAA